MKKFLAVVLSVMMVLSVVTPVMADGEISVYLDGEQLFFDVPPTEINGRVLVPVRVIFEALGATVDWDDATRTVIASKEETIIVLQLDNNIMKVNDAQVTLDVPATEIGGRTLVPVRAISEAFGTYVEWVDSEQAVMLGSSEEMSEATAAAIVAFNFMNALVNYDTEEMVRYADDPLAVDLGIDTLRDMLLGGMPAGGEVDVDSFINDLIGILANQTSYELKDVLEDGESYVFMIDLTSIDDSVDFETLPELERFSTDDYFDNLVLKMFENGMIDETMSEEQAIGVVMEEFLNEVLEAFNIIQFPIVTESVQIVVEKKDGRWLVNTAKSDINNL